MSVDVFAPVIQKLRQREAHSLTRTCIPLEKTQGKTLTYQGKRFINFSSNDYLGLRGHSALQHAWQDGLETWGTSSSASALITGYTKAHQKLEQTLCQWLGFEDVLLFSSGFLANQTVLFTLLDATHTLWQDKLNHASLQQAGHLCPARQKRFAHNHTEHLQSQLTPASGLIISEGVFSMDGDQAPLAALVDLAHTSQNALMLDDAHGLGVFGQQGRGTPDHQGIHMHALDVYVGTFSKALGGCGAFVGGKRTLIEALRQFGRGYIYSTHISSAHAAAMTTAIKLAQNADLERSQLAAHIDYLKDYFQNKLAINGPIIPVILKDTEKTLAACDQLKQQGLWCQAIRPPTVPPKTSRLRITLSAAHTPEDIRTLAHALELVL